MRESNGRRLVAGTISQTLRLRSSLRIRDVYRDVYNDENLALGAYNIWLVEDGLSRGNGIMVQVSVEEIQQDLAAYLQRVEAGETVVIVRAGQPIAEMKPVALGTKQLRPFGLCAGEFTVPQDFDAPLPEDILNAFEGA
jgi:antitoxin (DNA-binding transcriptional repressor) of toxin-antitoxin stability system